MTLRALGLLAACSFVGACGAAAVRVPLRFAAGIDHVAAIDASDELDAAARTLREDGHLRALVLGRGDRSRDDVAGRELGLRRARSVREELVRRGVAPARVSVAGHGDARLGTGVPVPRADIVLYDDRRGAVTAQVGLRLEVLPR